MRNDEQPPADPRLLAALAKAEEGLQAPRLLSDLESRSSDLEPRSDDLKNEIERS